MTLAERKIRLYIVIEVPSIIDALKDFPDELVKTITFNVKPQTLPIIITNKTAN